MLPSLAVRPRLFLPVAFTITSLRPYLRAETGSSYCWLPAIFLMSFTARPFTVTLVWMPLGTEASVVTMTRRGVCFLRSSHT